jgi:cobalt/nickel transport system permease protein
MLPGLLGPLWAIHLADFTVTNAWCLAGFVVAGVMAVVGAWRIRDEEIPRVALLTAAFFVASLIHLPAPTRPHLLLNGLMGVVLGRRAALAIPVGLFLQMALFQHGGWLVLGLNSCIMGLPALLAWLLFAGLRRLPWMHQGWFRAVLVGVSSLLFLLSLVYSLALLVTNPISEIEELDLSAANSLVLHPMILVGAVVLAGLAAWLERRLENTPEFPLGLLVGELAVLATVFLNGLVLLAGGTADFHTQVLLTVVVHLPLAVIEGIVLGFTVGFLVRVKPEMLGWTIRREAP